MLYYFKKSAKTIMNDHKKNFGAKNCLFGSLNIMHLFPNRKYDKPLLKEIVFPNVIKTNTASIPI